MKRTVNIWQTTDWTTILLFLLMVFLGWINIYSAVYNEEHRSILDFSQRYGKQLIFILCALALAFLTMMLESRFFSFFAYLLYGLSIASLILVLLLGTTIHGSRSWFSMGSLGLQPSEFTKIAVALAMAKYLSRFNLNVQSFRTMAVAVVLMLLPAALVLLQPDTGSALVFFSLFIVLFREGLPGTVLLLGLVAILIFVLALFIQPAYLALGLVVLALLLFWYLSGKARFALVAFLIPAVLGAGLYALKRLAGLPLSMFMIILAAMALSGIAYAYFIFRYKIRQGLLLYTLLIGTLVYSFSVDYVLHDVMSEHQQKRIKILLGLESDPFGDGYNVNQSKIAIGSGGFWGKGFLNGTQTKFHFVPEQSTDFIFCTVGEEWGFIGSTSIILLYLFLLFRLIILAERQRSSFSRIYGYAVFSILFFHFMVNIGMTIGLLPVIGIPLPFFSYGGSSLWAFTLLLFIFIRMDASRMELL